MNIYLLRHGETEENKKKSYYGTLDSGLNATGKLQAKIASEKLKHLAFDRVYISERRRTKETAQIVLDYDIADFCVDGRINEMDFGIFEGKNYDEIKSLYPIEYKLWEKDWKEYSPPEGESFINFYGRIKEFMDSLLKKDEKNVLLVTHGGVIRAIYCYVLGGNMDLYWNFSSQNGDISIIKYEYGNLFIDSITHAVGLEENHG